MTSHDLLQILKAVLIGATDAENRVFAPGDWPVPSGSMPAIKLRILREARQSMSRSGAPQFTTIATIRAHGEVEAMAEEDGQGAAQAEAAAWALKRQIEIAIVGSYPLYARIQQIASIDTQILRNSESQMHVAAAIMDFGIEFYEGPENFAGLDTADLDEVDLTVSTYSPVTATIPTT